MYENKKIFILGMARSGFEVAKLLAKHNNEITITDMKEQNEEDVKVLKELGVNYIVTDKPDELLDDSYDVLVKNPGIIKSHKCVVKAKELNMKVVNEVEVAGTFLPDVRIVGITGSNGKTTTTTLIYNILEKAGLPVHLGGNIGYPVSSLVERVKENDILVLEISDHQLVDMYDFKTDISVLTNLYQNHLDFHENSYDNYKNTKKKIFNGHTDKEIAIINNGNEDVLKLVSDIPSKKITFSSEVESDIYIKDDYIVYNDEKIININEIMLQGKHNYENAMCAIIVCKELGVSNDVINEVLTTFGGVEHRIEYVRTLNKRDFYNDSKSTNTDSTVIAVNSFKRPTILIMGGLDRGHSFDNLNEYMTNVKLVVCYGETKERISEWCKSLNIKCIIKDNLIDATNISYENSSEGDVILLSPGCASWDQYKCFEDRGNEFKETVNKLN